MGAGEATKTLCMWAVTVFSFHLPWRLPAELLIRYGIVWGGTVQEGQTSDRSS